MAETCHTPIVVVGHTFYCGLTPGHDDRLHRARVDRERTIDEYTLERGAEITWPVET